MKDETKGSLQFYNGSFILYPLYRPMTRSPRCVVPLLEALVVAMACVAAASACTPRSLNQTPALPPLGQETPASPSTQSLVASLESALTEGQSDKAREILERILERTHLNADTLLQVGVHLAQQDFYIEASRVFSRCASEYPEVFEGHYNLALAEFALQRFPNALAALRKAPQGSSQQELARRYLRGKVQDALGRPQEAEQDLRAAFLGQPNQENYALDLGLLYLRQSAYPKAAEIFQQGTRSNPRSPFLWLGFGLAEFLGGHAARSIQACENLLALQPEFSPARLLLAFVLNIGGKLPEAAKVAAEGLAGSSPDPYLFYLHATVLLKLHSSEYDEMLRELAMADRAIPACGLCGLATGKVHQAQGDFQAAIADLEKAVKVDPELSEAWYRLAPLYERAGRRTDAERARTRFAEIKRSDPEVEFLRRAFLKTLTGTEPAGVPH